MFVTRAPVAARPRARGAGRLALILALAAAIPSGLTACGAAAKAPTPIESLTPEQLDGPSVYRIGPGDELEVAFFHTPEMNTAVTVRPDGKIGLPLAQGVQAAGRTPEELANELRRRYGQELLDPEVAVIVRSFAAYRVHVGGEVEAPGIFPLSGEMTVLDAILQAGGYVSRARLSEVLVIRRDADGDRMVIPVDIEKAIDGTDPTQNLALLPYDAVVVPPSTIANVNTFIDLYIRQNLPVDFSVGYRPDF